jgi:hypothetical protein
MSRTLADTVVSLDDALRASVGGFWSNAVEEGGQGFGSIVRFTNDMTSVQSDLQSLFPTPTPQITAILADISATLSAADATLRGGGTFGSAAASEAALHTTFSDIYTQVSNEPTLVSAGFMQPAPEIADPASAPATNFAQIGAIFDDLVSRSCGGFVDPTAATTEVSQIQTDLKQLIKTHPDEFGGITGIHAKTIINQLELQKTYDSQYGTNPDAARGTNDNLLDIIDIVQGDTNLANMASQGGVAGWSPSPDAAKPTPKYQDNADQTNFWADFIAGSNSLGQEAQRLVGSGDIAAIKTLIGDLTTFENNTANFDAAQGGIFAARFDNELLGAKSTTGAEIAAVIKGLHTGNAALVMAGAEEMHANAADVSGNNIPVNGGLYNGDGLTLAGALSTATGPLPIAPLSPLFIDHNATADHGANTSMANGHHGHPDQSPGAATPGDAQSVSVVDSHHSDSPTDIKPVEHPAQPIPETTLSDIASNLPLSHVAGDGAAPSAQTDGSSRHAHTTVMTMSDAFRFDFTAASNAGSHLHSANAMTANGYDLNHNGAQAMSVDAYSVPVDYTADSIHHEGIQVDGHHFLHFVT